MAAKTPIAVALLVRDGKALLAHRHPRRRWYPDSWDLVGGHVEPGELPVEAVVRECLEELGVHVHDPVPFVMPFSDPSLEMHAFLITQWDGDPANCAPDEHDDLRWVTPEEITTLTLADPLALPSILGAIETPLR